MTLLCSSLLGAVGRGHFVITIFKNQIIWIVEMGWMVANGQACWRGRAVAVVILGFCFVLNLGDCGLMGVGRFLGFFFFFFFFFWPFFFLFFSFFFFKAASSTVSSCKCLRITTPPHSHGNHCN
uniref:Uncharacterized protein n=1 Tax=Mus musculus TaxID=10090 RepID=Q3USM7_MOUSE|nr:unnamed protein product [Mus musculus]